MLPPPEALGPSVSLKRPEELCGLGGLCDIRYHQRPQPWTEPDRTKVATPHPLLLADLRQPLQLLVLDDLGLLVLLDDHLHLHPHRQDVRWKTDTPLGAGRAGPAWAQVQSRMACGRGLGGRPGAQRHPHTGGLDRKPTATEEAHAFPHFQRRNPEPGLCAQLSARRTFPTLVTATRPLGTRGSQWGCLSCRSFQSLPQRAAGAGRKRSPTRCWWGCRMQQPPRTRAQQFFEMLTGSDHRAQRIRPRNLSDDSTRPHRNSHAHVPQCPSGDTNAAWYACTMGHHPSVPREGSHPPGHRPHSCTYTDAGTRTDLLDHSDRTEAWAAETGWEGSGPCRPADFSGGGMCHSL